MGHSLDLRLVAGSIALRAATGAACCSSTGDSSEETTWDRPGEREAAHDYAPHEPDLELVEQLCACDHSRAAAGRGEVALSESLYYGIGVTSMRIVQLSDIHVGSGLFKPDLLVAAVEETNALAPDLVAVAGDLTTEGYRHEFEEVRGYLDRLECPNVVVVMGNHDARNVGYRHFEDFFGARERAETIPVPEGETKLVALDTTKPDLDEGEVGREHYGWIDAEFRGWDRGPRILVIHHHILAVPGTGRDRNSLRDAGDVMALLRELSVDMVLAGHRHVPYVWSIVGVRVIHSGTVSTLRLRGTMPPSYNLIEVGPDQVSVTMRTPGRREAEEPLATFAREAVSTSHFYPAFERFVRFERLPFMDSSRAQGHAPARGGRSIGA